MAASWSSVGCHWPAAALARTWAAEVAPAITEEQPGWAARPPMAIWRIETPCSSPHAISDSTASSLASVT